ncbi:MAG: hypothetical protein CSB24_05320 [Deltaproteobacteria bacterium]|nr:MAG: hypothetical protein CSB24_05320 [Deltaproteobacteria bacterium]
MKVPFFIYGGGRTIKTLKFRIYFIFFILLTGSMVLSCFAVFSIQRGYENRERVRMIAGLIDEAAADYLPRIEVGRQEMAEIIKKRLGENYLGLILFRGRETVFSDLPGGHDWRSRLAASEGRKIMPVQIKTGQVVSPFLAREFVYLTGGGNFTGAVRAAVFFRGKSSLPGPCELVPALFYIGFNALIFATLGFFRLVKLMIRPLDRLVMISNDYLGKNELDLPLINQSGELAQLSFAINTMLGKITDDKAVLQANISRLEEVNQQLTESRNQVVRAEKMAAIGRLSAGMAHEIGNPLGIVGGYLELLQDDLADAKREEYCRRALDELGRIDAMIRQLLDFSRQNNGGQESDEIISVGKVCEKVVDAVKKMDKRVDYNLNLTSQSDLVKINADKLYQVLLNAILNSADAAGEKPNGERGAVMIKTAVDAGRIKIKIMDNGSGLAGEHLPNVFDPFFTTKEVGKGTGLGLFVSYAIIDEAAGEIFFDEEYRNGACLNIILPLVDG